MLRPFARLAITPRMISNRPVKQGAQEDIENE